MNGHIENISEWPHSLPEKLSYLRVVIAFIIIRFVLFRMLEFFTELKQNPFESFLLVPELLAIIEVGLLGCDLC